jgi:hypothetical protein
MSALLQLPADIKDAGIASPTATVAGNLVRVPISAYRLKATFNQRGWEALPPLNKLTLLAGYDFLMPDAGEGINSSHVQNSQ